MMSERSHTPEEKRETARRIREWRRILDVMFSRGVVIGGTCIIVIFVLVAILAPLLSPYKPNAIDLVTTLVQPSKAHLLGTDELGRDVLSRVIYGSRISLLVGVVSVVLAGIVGMGLGLLAGYFGGWINIIIMRFIDALMALPPLVLVLALTVALGGGLTNVLVALAIGMMPTYCRLMCGQVLTIKESDYITAAHIIGADDFRIMISHLFPNSLPPLLVLITMNLGTAIMLEAILSFIGVGITAPTATWGSMINNGYQFLLTNPIISFAPGIAILLVVLSFNMMGDGLRDALDPKLRGII